MLCWVELGLVVFWVVEVGVVGEVGGVGGMIGLVFLL